MEGEINYRNWLDNDRQNSVKYEYNELVSALLFGQQMFIRNRNMLNRNDLKWMTDRLKHIGMKKGIYEQFKKSETDLKEGCTTLTRLVKQIFSHSRSRFQFT